MICQPVENFDVYLYKKLTLSLASFKDSSLHKDFPKLLL